MKCNFANFLLTLLVVASVCGGQDVSDPQPLIQEVVQAVGGPEKLKYPSKTIMSKKATDQPWFYHEITELERLKELLANRPR